MNRFVWLAALVCGFAFAGPGAHGPNGEHLDAPAGALSGGAAVPRVEARSEAFEIVARIEGGTLSIFVDRYVTNEPVVGAQLEVESGSFKEKATFRADQGDYAVSDPAMLAALSAPGSHPVLFTVAAGNDADLLEGTMHGVGAVAKGEHPGIAQPRVVAGMALGIAPIAGFALWLARRRSRRGLAMMLVAGCAFGLAAPRVFAGPGAHGPNGEHLDAPAAINASGLARLPDGSVNVPKAAQRRMGIRTAMPPVEDAAASVELPGRVLMNPNAGGRVQAHHGGRLEPGPKGFPVLGQAVQRGEVLVYTRHHTDPYAEANQRAQLAELRANRALAEKRVERLASLEGTVPRKDIEAARAEAVSLAERERSIGASLGAREAMVAPVSGVIARADAIAGQVVETGHVLFEIVDPRSLLIEATTTEASLAARIGAASLQGAGGAKLTLLGAARSLRDGVLPITFEVAAAGKGALPLAVGQPVTVIARLREHVKGLVLPAQAVVRNPANEPIVWIKSGTERFIPQPVRYQPLDTHTLVVTGGLGADNRVVVQGAPLIAQIR